MNGEINMNEKQIEQLIREKVTGAINAIADRNYEHMLDFVRLDTTSYFKDKNEIESIKQWGVHINQQVDVLKPISIDKFDESCLDEEIDGIGEEFIDEGSAFIGYSLKSNGKYIDHMNMEFRVLPNALNTIEIFWSWNV